MTLTFLTLAALVGWAGWRLLSGGLDIYGTWADLAVFGIAALVFLGAGHAGYKRPALLAGWDWLGLGLLFFLVRQLSSKPEERHGWVAVLLAGSLAASAEGVFQAVYALPAHAEAETNYRYDKGADDSTAFLRTQALLRGIAASPLELHEQADRLDNQRASGPYFHPASLAAVLALAFPLAVGAALASLRGGSPPWQTILAAAAVLLIGAALLLTWQRSAVFLLALAGVGLMCCAHLKRPFGLLASLVLIGMGVAGVVAAEPASRAAEVWPAAWRVVCDNVWFGLGPAQFVFAYPRYLATTAAGKFAEPGGIVLDLWVNAGVFGVLALVAAVVLVGRAIWRWRGDTAREGGASLDDSPSWEFYLGGTLGLVLAFLLRARTLTTDDILNEAIISGCRAVVWFAAFALYEGVGWTASEHLGALATGAVAMLLCFLLGPGIDYPSVSVYLWVAAALILATASPVAVAWLSGSAWVGYVTAPASVAIAFGYFAFTFYPAANSAGALRRSTLDGLTFYGEERERRDKGSKPTYGDPAAHIRKQIIGPVQLALTEDAENVRLMGHLANWYSHLYEYSMLDERFGGRGDEEVLKAALRWAAIARKVAPESFVGYQSEDDIRRRFGSFLQSQANRSDAEAKEKEKQKDKKEKPDKQRPAPPEAERKKFIATWRREASSQFTMAAAVLESFLPYDPSDPKLHYDIAASWFAAGRPADGRKAAQAALAFDDDAKPPRKLPRPQREQLTRWLEPEAKK